MRYKSLKLDILLGLILISGYGSRYQAAKQLIEKRFPNVQVQSLQDPGTTSNFEIRVNVRRFQVFFFE